MWYGFNEKGECLFSASDKVKEEAGSRIIEAEKEYDISSICLIDGEIREPPPEPPTVEVIEDEDMPTEQVELYDAIAGIYELLEEDKK